MLELLRASVLNTTPNISIDIQADWDNLMDVSKSQNIIAWIWDGICKLPKEQQPPRNQRVSWGLSAELTWKGYNRQEEVLSELTQVCKQEGIQILLMKGIELSKLYPKPQSRPSSDIDIYLFDDYEKGNQLFGDGLNNFNHKHTSFDYHGVHIENHLTPIDTDSFYQKRVEDYLESEMHSLCMTEAGYLIFTPLPYLVYLTTHAIRHFEMDDMIPIRIFLDIAFFIREHQSEIDMNECYETCKKLKIEKALVLFVIIAEEILSINIPLYSKTIISHKDAELAKYCFLEGIIEKRSPYEIYTIKDLFEQWEWYIKCCRLYKYIPKTLQEKYLEFRHQVGITIKAMQRMIKNGSRN